MQDPLFSCQLDGLPWVPWAMPGAVFKLLATDSAAGRFSLLIRLTAGCQAPAHRHVGAVEGLVLEGAFYYSDAPEVRYTAGTYLLERAGAVHQPVNPDGALLFAVFHGPVEGLDDEGNVTGRLDWQWHRRMWDRQTAGTVAGG